MGLIPVAHMVSFLSWPSAKRTDLQLNLLLPEKSALAFSFLSILWFNLSITPDSYGGICWGFSDLHSKCWAPMQLFGYTHGLFEVAKGTAVLVLLTRGFRISGIHQGRVYSVYPNATSSSDGAYPPSYDQLCRLDVNAIAYAPISIRKYCLHRAVRIVLYILYSTHGGAHTVLFATLPTGTLRHRNYCWALYLEPPLAVPGVLESPVEDGDVSPLRVSVRVTGFRMDYSMTVETLNMLHWLIPSVMSKFCFTNDQLSTVSVVVALIFGVVPLLPSTNLRWLMTTS